MCQFDKLQRCSSLFLSNCEILDKLKINSQVAFGSLDILRTSVQHAQNFGFFDQGIRAFLARDH